MIRNPARKTVSEHIKEDEKTRPEGQPKSSLSARFSFNPHWSCATTPTIREAKHGTNVTDPYVTVFTYFSAPLSSLPTTPPQTLSAASPPCLSRTSLKSSYSELPRSASSRLIPACPPHAKLPIRQNSPKQSLVRHKIMPSTAFARNQRLSSPRSLVMSGPPSWIG